MSKNNRSEEGSDHAKRTYSAWFGFAIKELTPHQSVRIHIKWGRIALTLLVLGIVLSIAKSYGLYYFFREVRGFEDVSFSDMIVFPMNRGNVRIQQGNYQIEQAKAALEREDYRRAYSLLREGVARSPENIEGRTYLAQIYAGWRPDLASDLLVEGIESGKTDSSYVNLMCRLLLSQKDDEQIFELTQSLLSEDLLPEIKQILMVTRLQAAMFNGKSEIVKELFETTDLKNSLDGILLGTEFYVRTGRAETAGDILTSVTRSIPKDKAAPVYSHLISILKNNGDLDRAREVALEVVIGNPMEWRPRITLIDILSASDRFDRRDREIAALIKQHRNDEQAMVALSQICADYGNVEAASRLYELALENGYNLSLFSLTLAEALVQDEQFERAINLCNELIREDPSWLLNAEGSFNAIRSLAYFGYGDPELGGLYLKNFLDSKQSNVSQLQQAAKRFREFGLDEQAYAVLLEASRRDVKNEGVLASLVDVEMDLGLFFSLDEHMEALFELRRPDYALIKSIHDRLQSDRFLFTENRGDLLSGLASILAESDQADWEIWDTIQDPAS